MEDDKIIELYWNRNEEAIRLTSEKYGAFCYHIAHNILRDAEDAGECVNDTWFRAWTVIPPNRPRYLQAFLGKITRNLSLDRYRKNRADKRGGGTVEVLYDELEECISDSRQEIRAEDFLIAEVLEDFLESLAHDARIIFVRRYWYMDSIEQISNRYNMTQSKVKSSLMRSRGILRQLLEKEGITL